MMVSSEGRRRGTVTFITRDVSGRRRRRRLPVLIRHCFWCRSRERGRFRGNPRMIDARDGKKNENDGPDHSIEGNSGKNDSQHTKDESQLEGELRVVQTTVLDHTVPGLLNCVGKIDVGSVGLL